MYCTQCGTQLSDNARFCASCGARVNGQSTRQGKEIVTPAEHRHPEKPAAMDSQPPNSGQPVIGKAKKPFWKKIIIWASIVILAVLALAMFMTQGLGEAVDTHLDALRKQDLETAYLQTSKQFRASTTLSAFQQFVDAYPELTSHTGFDVVEQGFENDSGRVIGHLTGNDGTSTQVEFLLAEEDDTWKIQGFELKKIE